MVRFSTGRITSLIWTEERIGNNDARPAPVVSKWSVVALFDRAASDSSSVMLG